MTTLDIIAVLLTLSAAAGYVNERYVHLPHTIGLVLMALIASMIIVAIDAALPSLQIAEAARSVLSPVDFRTVLLDGFLSALLFAGALHVDLGEVAQRRAIIIILATVGVLVSTAIVGILTWLAARTLGLEIPLIWCFVFGALISPTDPIAVIAIMRNVAVPSLLRLEMAGESLLNDGVGVVCFTILVSIAMGTGGSGSVSDVAIHVAELFAREALGGAVLGGLTGALAFLALRRLDEYVVEIVVTLALVAGTYAVAQHLHVSGPIAVVVAGVLIGNHGAQFAMSQGTRDRLFPFWELIDEVLNSVLFLLIGLEILLISAAFTHIGFAAAAIPIVLFARLVSVAVPVTLLSLAGRAATVAIPILTWGGLRGAISVALALALPDSVAKDTLLTATYAVVVFSILVQGLTIERLVRHLVSRDDKSAETRTESA